MKPLPLWEGDREELTLQLKQAERHVTQAGYPEDHLDTLYRHENCQITGCAPLAKDRNTRTTDAIKRASRT